MVFRDLETSRRGEGEGNPGGERELGAVVQGWQTFPAKSQIMSTTQHKSDLISGLHNK